MTASADRLVAQGPLPKEFWLTVGLSVLLHGVLLTVVILMPRFRIGTYVTVPVSYTVNLVSAAPGGRPAPAAKPSAPPAATPPSAPPVAPPTKAPAPPVAPAPAPPPRPVAKPSEEELTLPAKRPVKKAPAESEPSLRPPPITGREALRPPPADTRPRAPAAPAAPATPAAPVAPAPQVASAGPSTGQASVGAGPEKGSGVELAGGEPGQGQGGSALGYYLGLVDNKIQTNWVPVGSLGGKDTVVVIRFRVLRSGSVRDVGLETSSGDAGLDTAALRAIRQSVPLPPFPNLLTEPFLDLRYRFVMERG